MSQHRETQEFPKQLEAGKLLSERLRRARETSGPALCPACHRHFDATHVIRCPECRTFIDAGFQTASSRSPKHRPKALPRKTRLSQGVKEKVQLELDFFTQGYMEYKG